MQHPGSLYNSSHHTSTDLIEFSDWLTNPPVVAVDSNATSYDTRTPSASDLHTHIESPLSPAISAGSNLDELEAPTDVLGGVTIHHADDDLPPQPLSSPVQPAAHAIPPSSAVSKPPLPSPVDSHSPIATRRSHGIIKPNPKYSSSDYCLLAHSLQSEPKSIISALKHPG